MPQDTEDRSHLVEAMRNHADKVQAEIIAERIRQITKFGDQTSTSLPVYCLILGEEFGELQKAVLEAEVYREGTADEPTLTDTIDGILAKHLRIREELVQVIAVGVAMLENIDREQEELQIIREASLESGRD